MPAWSCHFASRPSKMPTMRHSQMRVPSALVQMKLLSGTMSPSFQPYLSASLRPTMAPSWVDTKARHCSSGMTHSG